GRRDVERETGKHEAVSRSASSSPSCWRRTRILWTHCSPSPFAFLPHGGAMTLTWHGAARGEEVVNLGPLALIQPLLDQLDIASIIDRHLPPDPQLEFSHGQVLSLLLAARLCQPTALINLPAWAERT